MIFRFSYYNYCVSTLSIWYELYMQCHRLLG